MKIPHANLGAFMAAHRQEIDQAIVRVLEAGRSLGRPENAAFEREFSRLLGGATIETVATETAALGRALKAIGLKRGDEVITVAFTSVATVAAIVAAGGRPVFVDVCPDDLTLDPTALADAITPRTQAVIPVHRYGQPARLLEICAWARRAGLAVIEDCTQARGANYAGRSVGTWGQFAIFSFESTTDLGALRAGRALVTANAGVADKLRAGHGWRRLVGAFHSWSSRLDELQAAVLRVRLQYLPFDTTRRRAIAATYSQALLETGLTLPLHDPDRPSVYQQYVVRHPRRDQLRADLLQWGVETGIHDPVPVHLQAAYRQYGHGPGSLPVTELASNEILSLPIYPELRDEEIRTLLQAIQSWSRQPVGWAGKEDPMFIHEITGGSALGAGRMANGAGG